MKNYLVTFLYPDAKLFFNSFCQSLNNQTNGDFFVIIFTDGVANWEVDFGRLKYPKKIIPLQGANIGMIRYKAIEYLKAESGIENIIFQDIDDQLSTNRVEVSLELLQKYDLICNDLTTFNDSGYITVGAWSTRLENNWEFTSDFIKGWNIVGLGNTAIKRELLEGKLYHSPNVIAYDWFLFYQIMKNNNIKGVFTSTAQTFYRQHSDNCAGLSAFVTSERLTYVLNLVKLHYRELISLGYWELENHFQFLEGKMIKNNKQIIVNKPMFWWEEITLL